MKIKLLLLVLLISMFTACSGGRYYDSGYGYDNHYPRQNVTNKYYVNPTAKPTSKYFTKKKKATPKPKSTPKKYKIKKKTSNSTKKKVDIKKKR